MVPKVANVVITRPSNSTLRYCSMKNEYIYLKDLHVIIHGALFLIASNLETTKKFIERQIGKQIVVKWNTTYIAIKCDEP